MTPEAWAYNQYPRLKLLLGFHGCLKKDIAIRCLQAEQITREVGVGMAEEVKRVCNLEAQQPKTHALK